MCESTRFHQLTRRQIVEFSDQFEYPDFGHDDAGRKFLKKIADQKFLSRDDFLKIVEWKNKRGRKKHVQNSDVYIQEVTRLAFLPDTSCQLRIELLTLLRGVGFSVASAILHFSLIAKRYPIIDFRALWSIYGTDPRKTIKYDYNYWKRYCLDCRALSRRHSVCMRVLDKALWQYSKKLEKEQA